MGDISLSLNISKIIVSQADTCTFDTLNNFVLVHVLLESLEECMTLDSMVLDIYFHDWCQKYLRCWLLICLSRTLLKVKHHTDWDLSIERNAYYICTCMSHFGSPFTRETFCNLCQTSQQFSNNFCFFHHLVKRVLYSHTSLIWLSVNIRRAKCCPLTWRDQTHKARTSARRPYTWMHVCGFNPFLLHAKVWQAKYLAVWLQNTPTTRHELANPAQKNNLCRVQYPWVY